MPELPEVETIVEGLRPRIIGLAVKDIQRSSLPLRRNSTPSALATLIKATVRDIKRRAKYIILSFNHDQHLLLHLGMSGRLLFHSSAQPNSSSTRNKHDHFLITFNNNSQLVLHDPRRFGICELCDESSLNTHPSLIGLGVEPLTDYFTGEYLHNKLQKRIGCIKSAIMDSSVVVGVGNIYVSESLFMTQLNPALPSNQLTLTQAFSLVENIKVVLRKAIVAGGSTLRDYVQADGTVGNFQNDFLVYAHSGQPCKVCDTTILRMVQNGRSTFFCPQCQQA